MKGLAVYTIIGACRRSRGNMSPIDPPATERKALPAKPSKKRETSIVAMFFATANIRRPLVDYTNRGEIHTYHKVSTRS